MIGKKDAKKVQMKIDTGETRGVIRKVDELGRLTLPKEFRKVLGTNERDKVEIFLLKDGMYLRRA